MQARRYDKLPSEAAPHSAPAAVGQNRGVTVLNVAEFGDPHAPTVLALHGLTGHGQRWAHLARTYLPDLHIVAPDLLGHGRSPWQPPWGIGDHVRALSEVIDTTISAASRPIIVIGHSFGGALAVHLSKERPADVVGLVLVDPAQGLDPEFALTVATDSLRNWDYPDADAARVAKRADGWADVPAEVLEAEIAEHLISEPHGRVGWRVSAPMTAAAWSDMSRPFVLPPSDIPTHVVVADRVDPPFVGRAFLDACAAERADSVTIHHADCGHMVPVAEPALCATLIRALL